MFVAKITDRILRNLETIEFGRLRLELPNGKAYEFAGDEDGPAAHLQIHDLSALSSLFFRGRLGFCEAYFKGKWDSRDLTAFAEFATRNAGRAANLHGGFKFYDHWVKFLYKLRTNSMVGSRRNIQAHYDRLGNEFYALWLDPTMAYSSGLFAGKTDDLTIAQHNKYDRILERIGDRPQKILEIGCGWGGFVQRGVERCDHRIEGLTISSTQHDYATRLLKSRIGESKGESEIKICDYRNAQGKYDAVVAIEMMEHVGRRYWGTFFAKVKSLLADKGKAVIQIIRINDEAYESYRRGVDPIRSYIFPGGFLPSPSAFRRCAEEAGLEIVDEHAFGRDYAKTLKCWRERFNAHADTIKAMNLDEKFMRLWRFYLSGCEGGFLSENTDVAQIELRHAA